jgi:tetratricopeptide (TPR) repeat protein
VVLLLVALAACAPPPRPRAAVPEPLPRVARAMATPSLEEEAAAAPSTPFGNAAPPSNPLDERTLGEAAELTPALGSISMPTPTRAQLAAIPPPGAVAGAPAGVPAEPESLLSHIGPKTAPNVAAALRLIEDGRQQLSQNKPNAALDRFEHAVAIDPTNPYGYYFLAQVHYQQKKYDQAIAFASRAAVLGARADRPFLAHIYSLQGAVFEEAGRYPDARKAYQKAVEADPSNLAARVGVGRLSGEQERP